MSMPLTLSFAETRRDAGSARVAVVVPSYKATRHILDVIGGMGSEVDRIYVVDDCCPERTGDFVERQNRDPRVRVLRNAANEGVGGAVMHGYKQAIADGYDVLVKMDSDGQMDPRMLPRLVQPIVQGQADYTKGNRFYDLKAIHRMPAVRIFGNAVLSFMSKVSTGYWGMFDPTNGYTAISARVAAHVPMDKISQRYFFETDMLFRLNILGAVVRDIPMDAIYGDETSHLRISRILPEFLAKHARNFGKRIFYNYFLRDLNIASLQLVAGSGLLAFGMVHGGYHWLRALSTGLPTAVGIIMVAALTTLVGFQLLLAFLSYDMSHVPREPIAEQLPASTHLPS
ncbi:glycosyltransferase family 2 protein [Ramlibacter tataouinensis]|uniref:Candidate b-glycosyltransferase, Glycosyltransferase Family 2 n=1 Tax=Ramlibacter tataouinensis (strain ATCC BAA-407 / DSM 14655 / LMG 21543 / TTB310) TaxID=365046 RepID=F5XYX2_RAMTT|nr:glycosyltransferase family 2 protein [Ramlibacter tataouinensis]AEG91960.1 candidate b-glycosyltransferase, Glycosyltransferase Family 2 [Ramlibacter tataouinensis TTB310]